MTSIVETSSSNVQERVLGVPRLYWYFGFFVISGFCGLVYEVVWTRLAMASFGVTTAMVSIVISMFMGGLGLGSWAAGRFVRHRLRAPGRLMLHLYAATEFAVGISALSVPVELKFGRNLLLHASNFGAWQSSGYYVLAGAWVAVTLLPWCICMGATFPLLMAVIRETDRARSQHSFSYLYIANVLGALLGTIASAFVLIELLGFQGTLRVAGSLNTILAVMAFAIGARMVDLLPAVNPAPAPPPPTLYGLPRRIILCLLFVTGLVSMGMEIVWIRQFTPYLGNVVYAFAQILAVYLLATNLGSSDYRSSTRRNNPNQSASAWSLLALFAVVPVIGADPTLSFGPLESGLVRLSSIAFFCALVGFLTPMLVDCWSSGDPDRAGSAYAVNIVGCILGPLIAGFCLIPWLGERLAAAALALPLFAMAALVVFRTPAETGPLNYGKSNMFKFVMAAIAAFGLIGISHDFQGKFRHRIVRHDYTATVIATGSGFGKQLLVNGIGMTYLTPITKYLAQLPLAYMSRPPRNGLVICFGMGTSFRSMLSWGIPTTAAELVPSVPSLFSYFHPDASRLLRSPLAHIVIDDGRRYLDGSGRRFDVIVLDPPPPVAAPGSSLLYSVEFYSVVRQHLQVDGILETWYPSAIGDAATTASVTKALVQSFPHVRAFQLCDLRMKICGIEYLASMQPLPKVSSSVLAARMPAAAVSDFVEWGPETTAQKQFQTVLSHELAIPALINEDPQVPALTDDHPINEYYFLRSLLKLDR